jgi:hypothetical protein
MIDGRTWRIIRSKLSPRILPIAVSGIISSVEIRRQVFPGEQVGADAAARVNRIVAPIAVS